MSFLIHAKERPLKLALIKSCPTERNEKSEVHLFIIIAFLDGSSVFKWSSFPKKPSFHSLLKSWFNQIVLTFLCHFLNSRSKSETWFWFVTSLNYLIYYQHLKWLKDVKDYIWPKTSWLSTPLDDDTFALISLKKLFDHEKGITNK